MLKENDTGLWLMTNLSTSFIVTQLILTKHWTLGSSICQFPREPLVDSLLSICFYSIPPPFLFHSLVLFLPLDAFEFFLSDRFCGRTLWYLNNVFSIGYSPKPYSLPLLSPLLIHYHFHNIYVRVC